MVDDSAVADSALASEGVVVVTNLTATDTAVASDALSFIFYPGAALVEAGVASDSFTLGPAARGATLVEIGAAQDAWTFARLTALTETANASEAWAATVLSGLREIGQASSALDVSASYHLAIGEAAVTSETWVVEHTRTVSDTANASEAWGVAYVGGVTLSETASASDLIAPNRTLNITMGEVGRASVTYDLACAYELSMAESAQATLWMSPSGSVTAWAINTRTQAVSEYQGFDFNSFAQMGRVFVAADEDGLYELVGPSDDGVDVSAKLGGGFFTPNGPKTAGFKGIYLGVRGQGRYLLKLISGDGREWVYRANLNPGLMTTKITVGKGLHARYFAWELVNEDGQDFDLDTLEFVPMVSGRRVG